MDKQMLEELKRACLQVWESYKDSPWDYYKEKVNYVKSITHPDDYYILINMFDLDNQRKLWDKLSPEMRDWCYEDFVWMREYYWI